MTLTALVGALVALVPAVPKPKPKPKHELEIERLNRRVETLEYELESVTRELANERMLSTHWIGEASRIAKQARVEREQFSQYNALAQQLANQPQNPQQALAQALQAQQNIDYQQQRQQLAQQQAQNYSSFCNCVPSRSQVWGAGNDLVQQLNRR